MLQYTKQQVKTIHLRNEYRNLWEDYVQFSGPTMGIKKLKKLEDRVNRVHNRCASLSENIADISDSVAKDLEL